MEKLPLLAALTSFAALAGCATIEETVAEETANTYYATLTGAQEVGGGDPDGAGRAEISISDNFGQVCWDLNDISGIGPITAAHIHVGAAGTNGPPVLPCVPPTREATRAVPMARNGSKTVFRTIRRRSTSMSTRRNILMGRSVASCAARA